MRLLLACAGVTLLLPASALAGGPTMTVRDVPLGAARAPAATLPPFDLLGLHWRGSGSVSFRVRSLDGRWSRWTRADADGRTARGWRLGGLDWTGPAVTARFRTAGRVTRLRAYYVSSPVDATPGRRLLVAGSPPIISRLSWQADESIRRAPPQYADSVHFAVVHHTAGSNDYTRAESAAIVRGIELYHVQGNGWNDIGYNFLVDRFGQVFEGRYGGVDRAVIGAHAQGFNAGSVGVAVLGSYGATPISAAARRSLEQLLAWKLDLAHVDPLSTLTWRSGGNPRFPSGVPVFLRAISGHRDTGFTDCPGAALYAELPQLARDVAALGGPKIYAPESAPVGEGQVRFTARLSADRPWTVTIVDSTGAQVAEGAGTGVAVDWTWDGSTALPGRYGWTIASPGARPASGTVAGGAALAVERLAALQAAVAPGETLTVSFTLTTAASVTASLLAPSGETLSTLPAAQRPAGAQTLVVAAPSGVPNGRYSLSVTAASRNGTAAATIPVTVDDILTGFTSSGASLGFTLTRVPLSLAFEVLHGGEVVATQTAPLPVAGPQTLTWDGLLGDGSRALDGTYLLALTVTDDVGTFTRTASFTIDTTPPRVRVLSYRRLRFRVDEASTLTLLVGSRRYVRTLGRPQTTQFRLRTIPSRYTLLAVDAAGNRTVVRYRRRSTQAS